MVDSGRKEMLKLQQQNEDPLNILNITGIQQHSFYIENKKIQHPNILVHMYLYLGSVLKVRPIL